MIDRKAFTAVLGLVVFAGSLRYLSYLNSPPPEVIADSYLQSLLIGLALIFVIYLIGRKITGDEWAGVFSAAMAAAIPLWGWKTTGVLIHTLALFLFAASLLGLMYVKELGWLAAIAPAVMLSTVHVYSLALIPILLLYFAFVRLDNKQIGKQEAYFFGASFIALSLAFFFLTAKPALLLVVENNLVSHYYVFARENFRLIRAFAITGVLPIYLGVYGAYVGVLHRKKPVLLMLSAGIVFLLAMAFRLVSVPLGLPYLGVLLASYSGFVYYSLSDLLVLKKFRKIRAAGLVSLFTVVLVFGTLHWLFTQL